MKYFVLIFFLLFSHKNYSQLIAPDFTMTDINGVTRNLYTELDNGKPVILEFFMNNCGTCQVNTPVLQEFWMNNCYNGDSVWVWSIEINGVSDSAVQEFYNLYPASFPAFSTQNNNSVVSAFNVTYAPQYLSICPNRFMKSVPIEAIQLNDVSCPTTGIVHLPAFHEAISYSISDSELKIDMNSVELPATISLYSGKGETVLIKKLFDRESVIHLHKFTNGIYYMKVNSVNGKVYTEKINLIH